MGKYNIFAVIVIAVLFRAYVLNSLFPIYYNREPLFFTDILGKGFSIPFEVAILAGIGNIILIWLIGRRLINRQAGEISALVYAISPWTAYLEAAGSFYIFLLSCLLLSFWGLVALRHKRNLGLLLFITGTALSLYSSLWAWLIIPSFLWGATRTRMLNARDNQKPVILLMVILLPLIFFGVKNVGAARNIIHGQIRIFSDIGLVNTVNSFRGEIIQTPFSALGKFVENRYFYLGEHLLVSIINYFNPVLYFTPDVKILGNSASPPVMLGFLIPFILGLEGWKKLWQKYHQMVLVLLSLMVPSLLSFKGVDFGKLVIFSPLIFFTIGYGATAHPVLNAKGSFARVLIIVLIAVQFFVVLADLPSREPNRLQTIRMENIRQ